MVGEFNAAMVSGFGGFDHEAKRLVDFDPVILRVKAFPNYAVIALVSALGYVLQSRAWFAPPNKPRQRSRCVLF